MLKSFKFASNTSAGCANQHYFEPENKGAHFTSRAYFRIDAGGEYNYSLLFSGVHDSSYRKISIANQRCDYWQIHSARVAACHTFPEGVDIENIDPERDLQHTEFIPLSFGGKTSVRATPDLFSTDPVRLRFEKGEYLCLELEYSGERIPCHPEVIIPVYTKDEGAWTYTVNMPLPCMIGCDRAVEGRIAFLGDSITQGVGTTKNAYSHLAAFISDKLRNRYSVWNLGIGFGKASDAATDSAWLAKAKSCDTVFVCFGVNDVNGDYTADSIKSSLSTIVERLQRAGCRVILQTLPPYDHTEPKLSVWREVNRYIKDELSSVCDRVFDVSGVLSASESTPEKPGYGGHPNDEGNARWAEALFESVKDMF